MSAEAVRQVIMRAVGERDFRALLLRQPTAALAGYGLTAAEREALHNLTPQNFDSVAAGLAERDAPAAEPDWWGAPAYDDAA